MNTKYYLKTIVLILFLNLQFAFAENNSAALWSDISSLQAKVSGEQLVAVSTARYLSLDIVSMRTLLSNAPMEGTETAKVNPLIFSVPMPDGTFSRFAVVESPVMHPALAAKYPMIKTYAGQGLDDESAIIRMDVTQFGFHAMILSTGGDVFIDPINLNTIETYICYYKHEVIRNYHAPCEFDSNDELNAANAKGIALDRAKNQSRTGVSANRSAGTSLRTYRLALACTGEYCTVFGGTVPGALAAMVSSVNRIDGVYQLELAIKMVLIQNNDTLIFTNAATDPYTNTNGTTMLGQNQNTVNTRIGAANYDFGHVFSTWTGGGIAGLGVVCNNSQKARAVTGFTSVGDPFDIDYVAHEMGHQFSGNHTFNTNDANCVAQRNASTAYEPGSGITIMGYAGVCGSDNLSNHSIPNFHTISFDEIQNFTTTGGGATCAVTTPTGNNPPVITMNNYQYDIPFNTPFKLTGAGTDPNGDTLTYSFEEFDLGAASSWNTAIGNAPIFGPIAPTLNPWRLLPKLSNIRTGINSPGEFKPNYARTLHFRLTLRDNRLNGGGVTYDDSLIAVNVVNTVTPFAITYPNTTGISWPVGSTQTITWDVANTTAAPINTSMVNIYLSTVPIATYPFAIQLATNVPNTGSYTFVVPNNITTTARVLVEAVGNIFFDINDKNFAITSAVGIDENTINGESINVYPNPAENSINIILSGKLRGDVQIGLTNALGQIIYSEKSFKNSDALITNLTIESYPRGVYFVKIDSGQGSAIKKIVKL